jgi:CIC family chloride channel protein
MSDFTETIVNKHQWRLILDTVFLGVVGALSAQLFMLLLGFAQTVFLAWMAGYQPPGSPAEGGALQQIVGAQGLLLIPLATTLGGLLSGVLVYSLAPEAEGHGTDTAVKAFHQLGGFIRARVPPLKMVASAITIGSGGAAGREGPTALISAGVGSLYATLRHRSDEERRLLVLIGMAAGLSAIFRSPIGTAFFAIEVLYQDMEFDAPALFYTMIASVVAYVINGVFVGWRPLFDIPANVAVPELREYVWYAALGLCGGLVATLLPAMFYGLRDLFKALPFPPHIKPAIGGLGVGLLALELPQVLGGGYGWIQQSIDGKLPVMILLSLLFAKMLAFSLTVSSGGSGGVFAPSLFVGAMLGGFTAELFHQPPAPFVVVGMAAVFGGAARVPIATLLMVTEMTGGYHLLVPAALAVMLSYLTQSLLSQPLKYKSLYESQVKGRADSPAHRAEHVRTALTLLKRQQGLGEATVGRLDLITLLKSGIPLDLPDGKQLLLGTVHSQSSCADKPIASGPFTRSDGSFTLVAILRRDRMLLPDSDAVLHGGDQIIAITTPQMWQRMSRFFVPPPRQDEGQQN